MIFVAILNRCLHNTALHELIGAYRKQFFAFFVDFHYAERWELIFHIAAIKEASGNMAQVMEIFQKCGDRIDVYSGEDGLVVPMLAMGGMGCISVMSNVVPRLCAQMKNMFFAGDLAGAAALQLKLLPLVGCLFSDVNPIPAKAAVSAMGFGEEHLRLPLTPMEPAGRKKLFEELEKLGVRV